MRDILSLSNLVWVVDCRLRALQVQLVRSSKRHVDIDTIGYGLGSAHAVKRYRRCDIKWFPLISISPYGSTLKERNYYICLMVWGCRPGTTGGQPLDSSSPKFGVVRLGCRSKRKLQTPFFVKKAHSSSFMGPNIFSPSCQ